MLTSAVAGALVGPVTAGRTVMRVRILRSTVAGGASVRPGAELDLPDSEARLLVNLGKAERVVAAVVAVPQHVSMPAPRGRRKGQS